MKSSQLVLPLAVLLLSGCQSASIRYDTPFDNPHIIPPTGSVIVLNQTLTFSPNNSRSNIQSGKAIGNSRYDRFQPMCQFYLYESKDAMKKTRTIEPDRFTVVKSSQYIDYALTEPVKVAFVSIGSPVYLGNPFDDDIGTRTMKTTMRLRSEKQPQVQELRCMQDDDPYLQNYVSINEMIQTLGDVATLELPATAQ